MIIVAGANSRYFKMDPDQCGFVVGFVVVPGETIFATIGIGDVDPIEGPAIAVITSLGSDGARTFSSQESFMKFFLFGNASGAVMDKRIQSLPAALGQPFPGPFGEVGLE